METIITDIEKLKSPAGPLEFIDDAGTHPEEGREIISKIKEIMEADKTILALSAPQIGINKRIFCIRFNDIIKTFINPIIKKKSDGIIRFETNASMPNKEIAICRPKEVELIYYTDEFKYEDNKLLGSAAAIFVQQYELLDGIIPGEAFKLFNSADYNIKVDDIPTIIASEYSGDGIVIDISSDEDHFTSEDIETIADILGKQQLIFKTIGASLIESSDTAIKLAYKNLKYYDKVCLGEIIPIEDQPKMNREQRRAAAKQAQKIKTKKAGK